MGIPLLLSPPARAVVKDAARAVKRVDSLMIQAMTAETLSKLLGLPGMRVTQFAIEKQGEEKYLHLFCEHEHDVAICPRCGKAMASGYDHKDRSVRHLDIWGIWKALATGSRYLIRFVKALRNWWHEFLNYFDDRVTQGFVEGVNRAIRGIINRAFGFRNFDNFRLQVLVECGGT